MNNTLRILLSLVVCGTPLLAQIATEGGAARSVVLLSEAEQKQFVHSFLAAGLPEASGDRFSFLLANRSAVVVPMLETEVENELRRSPRSERFIDLASALIAYAGDDESLRGITKLIQLDEARFGPLVDRTLDNASNWRNPFSVAYQGYEMGDEAVSRHISAWAESALTSPRVQRAWAESLLERYGKVPGKSELASDPIASRLKNGPSPELQQNVVNFATEALRQRLRR